MREGARQELTHLVATVEDVLGERTHRRVALRCCGQVATSVAALLIPAFMMSAAVAFDDQPAVDDEVDPSDPIDRHLDLDRAVEGAEHEAHEALRAGLRAAVEQPTEVAETSWQATEDGIEARLIEDPEVKGAVESGDRRPRFLTSTGLRERIDGVHHKAP